MNTEERMQADWNSRAMNVRSAMRFIIDGFDGTQEEFIQSGERHWNDVLKALRHSGLVYPDNKRDIGVEIGCGVGRMTIHAAAWFKKLYALDISEKMISYAPRFPSVTYVATSTLTVIPSPVDYIFSMIVFQHMPKSAFWKYLSEAAGILRSGGIFCAQMNLGTADWPDTETLMVRGYTADDFSRDNKDMAVWSPRIVMDSVPGTSEKWHWLILERF